MVPSYIASFIAMMLAGGSYFLKKKSFYLIFQFGALLFLVLSYFFSGSYVPMIGLIIALLRTFIFYLYERKDKTAPLYIAFILSTMTLIGCLTINKLSNKQFKPIDTLYIISAICYIFVFKVRNLKIVRFTILIPLTLSIIYNSIAFTTPFIIVSYSFETIASIVSIFKYYVFNKEKGEITDETN